MTLRDEVWDECLTVLKSRGKLKISELSFDEEQRHTVRRTLREMESLGWVTRESEQAAIWRIGSKAELILDLDEDTIENSKQ